MPALNYRQLKRFYDLDPRRTCAELLEGLGAGHLRVQELSLRGLFEALVEDGRELVRLLDPRQSGGTSLVEAAGAVDTAAFSNITGQIVYSKALEIFRDPAFLWPQLVETVPTQFSGEKIPGIGRMGDQAETIAEGHPYPLAGLSEEYVETPETAKRGFIVPVTKEAIFFDRTGLVLRRAAEVARWLGVNKEKRVLDVVLGVENPYKRNGVESDTYLSSGDWVNIQASNPLEDWTDIETAELLLDAMSDPNTGEPIAVMPNTLIVPTALKHTARRIVRAVSITHVDNTAAADTVRTTSTNPLDDYRILSSPYVKQATGSDSTWFVGEPQRAFAYMENWPLTVTQAPDNSEADFTRDIVARFKVSERGAAAVLEPRRMVKCTG
jgi:hypothetical protein